MGTAFGAMHAERGFTIIELTVTVGIIIALALAGFGLTLSSRSLQVASAAAGFDALLAAARRSAGVSTYGETIAFVPDAFGDGFIARVYENRPGTVALTATTIPDLSARVALTETQRLGAPSFALTIHANGSVGGVAGDPRSATATESPCPPSGVYRLVFAYGGAQAERDVSCSASIATTGPPVLATLIPAVPLPSPTAPPCPGGCSSAPPSAPPVTATTIPVAIYFTGRTAFQVNAQAGGVPQPCAAFPLYADVNGTTGDGSSGGWFEDDWYLETSTTTVGAFVAQHALGGGAAWSFAGDGFGVSGGVYLDPTQVGATYRATGTYGGSTLIPASAGPASALLAMAPATPLLESDYLHESCYAAWADTPGG